MFMGNLVNLEELDLALDNFTRYKHAGDLSAETLQDYVVRHCQFFDDIYIKLALLLLLALILNIINGYYDYRFKNSVMHFTNLLILTVGIFLFKLWLFTNR